MSQPKSPIARITKAYDSFIIRCYVRIRFIILWQRFLDIIGQSLPQKGQILDIGCGFGLFSLFFAMSCPEAMFTGVDLNPRRIRHAQNAAQALQLRNVSYQVGNATELVLQRTYDAVYMLDIVHHIPPNMVAPLVRQIHDGLTAEGTLIIKDVDYYPTYQRWFTWLLDKMMDWHTPVHYWQSGRLLTLLRECGFGVHMQRITDILPYPHILYVCRKSP